MMSTVGVGGGEWSLSVQGVATTIGREASDSKPRGVRYLWEESTWLAACGCVFLHLCVCPFGKELCEPSHTPLPAP